MQRHPHQRRPPVQVADLINYLDRAGVTKVGVLKLGVERVVLKVTGGAYRILTANPGIVLVVPFLRENPLRFDRAIEDLGARLHELGFLFVP
jgi:hypothetical protein